MYKAHENYLSVRRDIRLYIFFKNYCPPENQFIKEGLCRFLL